jgi:hypothetical protein
MLHFISKIKNTTIYDFLIKKKDYQPDPDKPEKPQASNKRQGQ